MAVTIDGVTYLRTAEACENLGISRNTLFRWLKNGALGEVEYRDWRGWRLFTPAQVEAMKTNVRRITVRQLQETRYREVQQ